MANAVWRDKEREKNVKEYREEEKKEVQNDKSYSKDFIRYIIRHVSFIVHMICIIRDIHSS